MHILVGWVNECMGRMAKWQGQPWACECTEQVSGGGKGKGACVARRGERGQTCAHTGWVGGAWEGAVERLVDLEKFVRLSHIT